MCFSKISDDPPSFLYGSPPLPLVLRLPSSPPPPPLSLAPPPPSQTRMPFGFIRAHIFFNFYVKVEEFAEYGNLDESSSHHSVERLSRFTIEAATALEYLEKKNVVHQSLSLHCMVVADYQVNSAKLLCLYN